METTRINANVRINHVFSMNFTHFPEFCIQQWCFLSNWRNRHKHANTDNTMFIMLKSTKKHV